MTTLAAPTGNEIQDELAASYTRGTDTTITLDDGASFVNSTPLGHVVRINSGSKWCLVIYDNKTDVDTLEMSAVDDYALAVNLGGGAAVDEVFPIGSTVELVCAADEIKQVMDKVDALTTVATDAIWDAAGDLVQGTGANTAAKLTKGTALALLKMNAGGTAVEWGTAGNIAFPATAVPSADANTLDDYEEGTITPAFLVVSGTTDFTYSTQSGYYTKIGNIVSCAGRVSITSKGSSSGNNIQVTGLPLACANDGTTNFPVAFRYTGISFANVIMGFASRNETAINFEECTEGGTATAIVLADLAAASDVMFQINYQT